MHSSRRRSRVIGKITILQSNVITKHTDSTTVDVSSVIFESTIFKSDVVSTFFSTQSTTYTSITSFKMRICDIDIMIPFINMHCPTLNTSISTIKESTVINSNIISIDFYTYPLSSSSILKGYAFNMHIIGTYMEQLITALTIKDNISIIFRTNQQVLEIMIYIILTISSYVNISISITIISSCTNNNLIIGILTSTSIYCILKSRISSRTNINSGYRSRNFRS